MSEPTTIPCPNWNQRDFTCDLGTDCTCVEGQDENIVTLYGEMGPNLITSSKFDHDGNWTKGLSETGLMKNITAKETDK